MESTLKLLRSIDAVHGMPATEAADRLEAAMQLIASLARESALHPGIGAAEKHFLPMSSNPQYVAK